MAFGQYVNLDFDQIKTSIKDYLRSNTNFTDYDFEGSNLSIIIDALAYNTYTTAYNTNMAANECFLDSATLRENVVSLARNIGYVPRSRRSARANISLIEQRSVNCEVFTYKNTFIYFNVIKFCKSVCNRNCNILWNTKYVVCVLTRTITDNTRVQRKC